ncbi:MAG: hypothetical protein ACO2OR_05570 [Desulfurococcaceae archaeon]
MLVYTKKHHHVVTSGLERSSRARSAIYLTRLVAVSVNPCLILKLSLLLRVDTRYSCRLISETVCRMVLKCLNPELVFTRDYSYIRPYSSGCRERILLLETTALSARSPSTGLQ